VGLTLIVLVVMSLASPTTHSQVDTPRHPPQLLEAQLDIDYVYVLDQKSAVIFAKLLALAYLLESKYYLDEVSYTVYGVSLSGGVRVSLRGYNFSYTDPVVTGDIELQMVPGIPANYQVTDNFTIRENITRNNIVSDLARFMLLLSQFVDVILAGNSQDINNYIENSIRPFVGSLSEQTLSVAMRSRISITGLVTTCNLSSSISSRTTYGTLNNAYAKALILYPILYTSTPVVLNYCTGEQTETIYSGTLLENLLMFSSGETLSITYTTTAQSQDTANETNTTNETTLVTINELYLVFPHITLLSNLPLNYLLSILAQSQNTNLPGGQELSLADIVEIIQSGNETAALNALEQARKLLEEGQITETQYKDLLEMYRDLYGEVPAELVPNNNNADSVVIDLDKILSQINNVKEGIPATGENATSQTRTNIADKVLGLAPYIIAFLGIASAAMYGSLLYKRRELDEVLFLPRILLGKPPYENLADNIKWCYHAFIYVLSLRGLPKYEWETPREYLERVKSLLSDEYKILLEDLTREYEMIKYGEIPDPGLAEYVVEDCIREIRRALFTWHLKRDG